MKAPIEFYFDFSSPYGYLASTRIDALAAKHGRSVSWRPILLGPAFKAMGTPILAHTPLKGDYSMRDFPRSARFHGIAYNQPEQFPVSTLAATRVFYWLKARNEKMAITFAKTVFQAFFVDGINISEPERVISLAVEIGCREGEVRAALEDQAVKDRTKAEVEGALAKGIFGSPYIVVDGEPFWGMDRLDQVERWLEKPF